MVIFGAGGDLTKRLLVPALYNLASTELLPEHFALVGVDMADLTADQRPSIRRKERRLPHGDEPAHRS